MAMFSIVIPCLNEEKFVPQLLESLAHQNIKDFDVIVVDGNSQDKTVEVARSFDGKIPGLQVVVNNKASLPEQRNTGAKATSSEWLAFVDADSVFLPYAFERMKKYIENNSVEFFTSWSMPDVDKNTDAMLTLLQNLMIEGSLFLRRPLAPGPLTVVHRDVYNRVGGYNEEHHFAEDHDFSLRIVSTGVQFHILRETLYVVSLRRLRTHGLPKVVRQYLLGAIPAIFFKKPFKELPGGYIMGGQLYDEKNQPIKQSLWKQYEGKLRKLIGASSD